MANIGAISAIGFLSAFSGAMLGFLAALFSKKMGRRADGAVTGFTAGLLIAFVCFKILEEGFMAAPMLVGTLGILAGVAAAALLDGAISKTLDNDAGGLNTAAVTAAGVMLHHFPEGLALGAMCAVSSAKGLMLAAVICIHCIPESAAVFIPLGRAKPGLLAPLLFAAAISLPMAAGSALGALFREASGIAPALALTFSGGVMLYVTCGEMLPNSKLLWRGRLTTVCAALGFILGVVITA